MKQCSVILHILHSSTLPCELWCCCCTILEHGTEPTGQRDQYGWENQEETKWGRAKISEQEKLLVLSLGELNNCFWIIYANVHRCGFSGLYNLDVCGWWKRSTQRRIWGHHVWKDKQNTMYRRQSPFLFSNPLPPNCLHVIRRHLFCAISTTTNVFYKCCNWPVEIETLISTYSLMLLERKHLGHSSYWDSLSCVVVRMSDWDLRNPDSSPNWAMELTGCVLVSHCLSPTISQNGCYTEQVCSALSSLEEARI